MRMEYEEPKMDVVLLEAEDVVTTSAEDVVMTSNSELNEMDVFS